jgi:hypothetical protein
MSDAVPPVDPANDQPPPAGPPAADVVERNRWLEEELAKTRREAASNRVKARELSEQLAKAASPDVMAAKNAEIVAHRVRADLAEAFQKHDIRNTRIARAVLLDSGVMDRLHQAVDAEDYDEQVDTAVSELASNPELQARPRGPAGAEFRGAGYQSKQLTNKDQIDAMKPAEVVAALERGDFDQVLGRGRL